MTQLWPGNYGQGTDVATQRSLEALQTDYLDLYLLHWPGGPAADLQHSWRKLELLLDSGRARAIGVSNFQQRHLERLLDHCSIVPHCNQVEFHPFQQDWPLIRFCRERGMAVAGYSPLAKGEAVEHPGLCQVGAELGVTAAQVAVRFSLQHNIITIPKSTKLHRVIQNMDVYNFQLTEQQMDRIGQLNRNLRVTWDPTLVP